MHIRVGDTVEVIAGNDRGQRGKVLKVDRDAGKLLVEGMNRVFKHMRRSQRNPQGGRLSKEMPVQLSNVMLVCPNCNAASRTAAKFTADGGKERVCKKCKNAISPIAPPRTRLATTRTR
jgi:large subunit ribosomal protein L24